MMARRIFVPLASQPYWRFYKGSKGVEIRALESPVARAVLNHDMGTPVNLRRGYSTPDNIWGRLGLWVIADNVEALPVEFRIAADLPPQRRTDYYDPYAQVLAFQVLDTPYWDPPARQRGLACACGSRATKHQRGQGTCSRCGATLERPIPSMSDAMYEAWPDAHADKEQAQEAVK